MAERDEAAEAKAEAREVMNLCGTCVWGRRPRGTQAWCVFYGIDKFDSRRCCGDGAAYRRMEHAEEQDQLEGAGGSLPA